MWRRWRAGLLVGLVLAGVLASRVSQAAPAATFTVNATADLNDLVPGNGVCEAAPGTGTCSLRAAIQEANAAPGPDTIIIPAGTYALTRSGTDDTGHNGDLDIRASVTLQGAGMESTIIDAAAINDRVLDVISGTVVIDSVTLQHGHVSSAPPLLPGSAGAGVLVRPNVLVFLSNSLVTRNRGSHMAWYGGGVANLGGLIVDHSLVISNTVSTTTTFTVVGGGISDRGDFLAMYDSTLSGNRAEGDGQGGGLFTWSNDVFIKNSTISHNFAGQGGGIRSAGGEVQIVNSTLSGNAASQAGGGLYVAQGAVALHNVTVRGNSANTAPNGSHHGGGVHQQAGSVALMNSILVDNLRTQWPGPLLQKSDCSGSLTANGPNLVGDINSPCSLAGTTPLTGVFAKLGPLADNGGATATHALLATSPAIDAGSVSGCVDENGALLVQDQRGTPRPLFGRHSLRCDLGAVEYVRPLFVPLVQR